MIQALPYAPAAPDALVDRLFARLVADDAAGADEEVHRALEQGLPADAIAREVFLPLLSILRRLHEVGQMTQRAYVRAATRLAALTERTRRQAGGRGGTSRFVSFHFEGGALTARLAGPHVGEREAPIVSREVARVIDAHAARLSAFVIDLREVRVISSMALGMCLDLQRRAAAHGARTSAVGADESMRRVLDRLAPPAPRLRTMARFLQRRRLRDLAAA